MGASGKGVERGQLSSCRTLSRAVSGGETGTCLPDGQSNTARRHAAPSSRVTSGRGRGQAGLNGRSAAPATMPRQLAARLIHGR